jgi:hypothetical protein
MQWMTINNKLYNWGAEVFPKLRSDLKIPVARL